MLCGDIPGDTSSRCEVHPPLRSFNSFIGQDADHPFSRTFTAKLSRDSVVNRFPVWNWNVVFTPGAPLVGMVHPKDTKCNPGEKISSSSVRADS